MNDLLKNKKNNLENKGYILKLSFSKKDLEFIDIKFEESYKQSAWIDNYNFSYSQLINSGIFSNCIHFKNITKTFWNVDEIDFLDTKREEGIKINIKNKTCECWFFREYKDKLNLESDLDFYENYDTKLAELILY